MSHENRSSGCLPGVFVGITWFLVGFLVSVLVASC